MQALAHKHTEYKFSLNDVFKVDPSRTLTLRKAFIAEVNRRFRWLKRVIIGAVVDKDVFGLKEEQESLLQRKLSVAMVMTVDEALATVKARQFAFTRTSAKVDGFMDWLNKMEERSILEIVHRPGAVRGMEEAWSDHFIQSSYQKGILRGRQELRKAGAKISSFEGRIEDEIAVRFNQPFHSDRVGLLYTRTFNELKGITAAMDQQISSVLAQGLVEGRNPRELARWLTSTIEMPRVTVKIPGVGFRRLTAIQRARTMARTEIIRAHHQANIQEYRSAGIEGVKVQAEWSTAGHGVCEICAALEGKVFSLDEIEGMIPVHPNCRCMALPFRKEWDEKKVKPAKTSDELKTDWEKKKLKQKDIEIEKRAFSPEAKKAQKATFEAEMKYVNSLDRVAYEKHRSGIVDFMLTGDKKITPAMRKKVMQGTEYIPYDVLSEMKRQRYSINVNFRPKSYYRANFDPVKKSCHVAKDESFDVIGHEFGHAIDDFFGQGNLGGNWKESGRLFGKYTSKIEGEKFRGWFNKQHSGIRDVYRNGDGDFFRNNWLTDYEGRIYAKGGPGQEWWAMNCQRYSKYRQNLFKFDDQIAAYRKTVKRLGTSDPYGKAQAAKMQKMLDEGREIWAARLGEWTKAKEFYPELTDFIETKFGERTLLKW